MPNFLVRDPEHESRSGVYFVSDSDPKSVTLADMALSDWGLLAVSELLEDFRRKLIGRTPRDAIEMFGRQAESVFDKSQADAFVQGLEAYCRLVIEPSGEPCTRRTRPWNRPARHDAARGRGNLRRGLRA